MTKKPLDLILVILVIIGGLNWGLIGLFDINIVTELFGTMPQVVDLVYDVIGIASIYTLYLVYMKHNK